jgi:hypothetical protein
MDSIYSKVPLLALFPALNSPPAKAHMMRSWALVCMSAVKAGKAGWCLRPVIKSLIKNQALPRRPATLALQP